MNTYPSHADQQRLIEAAKRRAHQLRDQAQDQFWLDAGHQATRAALRLAAALARHRRLRHAAMEG